MWTERNTLTPITFTLRLLNGVQRSSVDAQQASHGKYKFKKGCIVARGSTVRGAGGERSAVDMDWLRVCTGRLNQKWLRRVESGVISLHEKNTLNWFALKRKQVSVLVVFNACLGVSALLLCEPIWIYALNMLLRFHKRAHSIGWLRGLLKELSL